MFLSEGGKKKTFPTSINLTENPRQTSTFPNKTVFLSHNTKKQKGRCTKTHQNMRGLCQEVVWYLTGSWYVIMTLSSVLAISSQMGSCSTHLMNWSSPPSPPALLLPPAGCLREWSFSEESMLPKYLLVWLPWLLTDLMKKKKKVIR